VSALALGSLWTDICQGPQAQTKSLQGLAFTPLSLDGNKCRQLVQQRWPAYKQALSSGQKSLPSIAPDLQSATSDILTCYHQRLIGLSQNDMLAACPSGGRGSGLASTISAALVGAAGVIANPLVMCMQCHSAGPNQFNFNNPASLSSEKDRIYTAVATEHMPLGVDMAPAARAAMLEYIKTAIPSP
jgi:mono/diheme cytochrome c family protein